MIVSDSSAWLTILFQKMKIKLFAIRNLEYSDNEISSCYIKCLMILKGGIKPRQPHNYGQNND